MAIYLPPLAKIRSRLRRMGDAELMRLAEDSGVSFSTLKKVKVGDVKNPGYETVRAFCSVLPGEGGEGEAE